MLDNITRIDKGFGSRIAILERLIDEAPRSSNHAHLSKRKPNQQGARPEDIDLRWIPAIFFSNHKKYTESLASLKGFIPAELRDIFIAYYYSSDSVADVQALLVAPTSDQHYSVIVQSLVASDKLPQSISVIQPHIDGMLEKVPGYQTAAGIFSKFNSLLAMEVKRTATEIKGLNDLNTFLNRARCKLVHIFGPEPFSAVQRLIDRSSALDRSEIERLHRIAKSWHFEDEFYDVLRLRNYRHLPIDDDAIAYIAEGPRPVWSVVSGPSENYWTIVSGIFERTAYNVKRCDASEIIEAIIELFNIDEQLVYWVNWYDVYDAICSAERIVGIEVAFFYLLASSDEVGEHFPDVRLAVGDGAFDTALRGSFQTLASRDIATLVAELRSVPGEAGRKLATAILRHDTASKFSTFLNYDAPWAKRLVQAQSLSFDGRAAAFRRDAARAFQKAKLIDEARSQQVQREAESILKVAYLRGRQLEGLVHVDFSKARDYLRTNYSNAIAMVQNLVSMSPTSADAEYRTDVADFISDNLTNHFLISGPSNLRTIVSDSLRHGQLPNRFLQAFDKAIRLTQPSVSDVGRFLTNGESTEQLGSELPALRADIKNEILSFNREYLSVERNDRLYVQIQQASKSHVDRSISAGNFENDTAWMAEMKTAIEDFLFDAREGLVHRMSAFVASLDNRLLSPSKELPPTSKAFKLQSFKAHLKQQIHEALRDTSQWIAIAKEGISIPHFTLEDLVELCLVNYSPTGGRRPSFKTYLSSRRRNIGVVLAASGTQIDGAYFELVESICKNLIGNCFEHSGLGADTRARLEFVVGSGKITVTFWNTLSPAAYIEREKTLPDLRKRTTALSLEQAAQDTSSGTAKMSWACNRVFGKMPKISFELDSNASAFKTILEIQHIGRPFLVEPQPATDRGLTG